MKKISLFLLSAILIAGCSSSKELASSRSENKKLKKLAEQAEIKKAVESRKYIIKVNRLYVGGGFMELIPTTKFVIINGEIASISLGYMGRSFGIHPITGINLNGRTANYKMESNESKGQYKIQWSVNYASDKFDVYLTINTSGNCDIALNNAYIQTVTYTGTVVPLVTQVPVPKGKNNMI